MQMLVRAWRPLMIGKLIPGGLWMGAGSAGPRELIHGPWGRCTSAKKISRAGPSNARHLMPQSDRRSSA